MSNNGKKQNKILVGVPTMGRISASVVEYLVRLAGFENIQIKILKRVVPVAKARNQLVDIFLQTTCTHLLFIDDDMIIKSEPLALLERNVPIIGGISFIYQDHYTTDGKTRIGFEIVPNVYLKDGGKLDFAHKLLPGVNLVDAVGSACILVKREVFEKVKKPWFKTIFDEETGGVITGEDIYFCLKAKEAGFNTWVDTKVVIGHVKPVDLMEIQSLLAREIILERSLANKKKS